ncbi:MAG TPA: 1,4-alpha-glucan branching protein domain-containing protein [Chthoniobacterales bacterium]|nr:1,4-alpha-glucan branching protein domain-containing protein [Chthoniobacterales bacterium]
MVSNGQLALILHAHLPFVRHPEHEHFLEEDWLFEAITETYIPLLQMMQRLVNDNVPFKLAMSLTPTLCAMLQDDLLRERYVRHLDLLIDLTARERKRNQSQPELVGLSQFYFEFFSKSRRFFVDEWKCDLLATFRRLREIGALEIIGCAATHALLPLIQQQSNEAARAQVLIGRDEYVDLFGAAPAGFWLPECAYAPGLDSILQEANLRWFVLETHGLLFGSPQPQRAIYSPCYTPAGPAAFARDRDCSRQVWSAQEGYPGHPAYREFYRDIGFDLPLEHLGPVARGVRKFSGVKYHRITGQNKHKELYDRGAADKAADAHAAHFLEQRRAQFRQLSSENFDPIVVAPFDAELFGHWWFEGPRFLEMFIRKTAANQNDFRLTTPTDYLAANPTQQTIEPAESSWGDKGYLEVWIDKNNSWIYPHLHGAAQRMHELATAHEHDSKERTDRLLKQLARELLLAQSSDWAFLMRTGTARDYASKRTFDHLTRFNELHDLFLAGTLDEKFLAECESRDNLFPKLNWRYYV